MNIEQIIQQKQGTIVDVRTPMEYEGGHVAGSINIPLHELPDKIEELKSMKAPLVLCCASGNRSHQANRFLTQQGIESHDGGSWHNVNYFHSQTVL